MLLSSPTVHAVSPTATSRGQHPLGALEYVLRIGPNEDWRIAANTTAPNESSAAPAEKEAEAKPKKKKLKQIVHTVKQGESLSKISRQYDTDWTRIYSKNRVLTNPDVLKIGEKLVIPKQNEKLKLRELPKPEPAPTPQPVVQTQVPVATTLARTEQAAPVVATPPPASSSGNTYYAGYCTWYAKSRRPDLPNNLGNASTWLARAAAQGFATGSAPRVGAIAHARTGYMHVAYVEAVHGNGTITVSEMNYTGFNVVSQRTAPAGEFSYIY